MEPSARGTVGRPRIRRRLRLIALGLAVVPIAAILVLQRGIQEAGTRESALQVVASAGLAAVLVFLLFLSLWYSRQLSRRILALVENVGAERDSDDEIGDLSRRLRNLLEQVRADRDYLERLPSVLRHETLGPLGIVKMFMADLDPPSRRSDEERYEAAPIYAGHENVRQYQVRFKLLQDLCSGLPIADRGYLKALGGKDFFPHPLRNGTVICQEYFRQLGFLPFGSGRRLTRECSLHLLRELEHREGLVNVRTAGAFQKLLYLGALIPG